MNAPSTALFARRKSDRIELPPMSDALATSVAIDHANKIFYIDKSKQTNPLMLSWLRNADHLCQFSNVFTIKAVPITEIAALHEKGDYLLSSAKEPKHDDMHVQQQALDLIAQAANIGASDLHILVNPTFTEVQVRSKGELRVMSLKYSRSEGHAIIRAMCQGLATVKNNTHNPKEFQDAQLSGKDITNLGLTSVRLVRGPCHPVDDDAEFAVLRLQYQPSHKVQKGLALNVPRRPDGQLNLAKRGYSDKQIEMLKMLACSPNGIIIFSGPTGSGKTTSLYEMLSYNARERPESRLITIEDPVEYPMPWAVQLVISNAANESETGKAFAERLRVSLRMDPDTLLLGELRGVDSAEAAINAALTGHQVWTTIHTNDAFQIVDRLEFMDSTRLARKIFCDHKTIRGLVAQRIIPTLCQKCCEPLAKHHDKLPAGQLDALKTYGDLSNVKVRGQGCPDCDNSGITGRMAIAEVVVTDHQLMKDFVVEGTVVARANHRKKPGSDNSLMTNAILRCLEGKVDPRDVASCVDIITPKGEDN